MRGHFGLCPYCKDDPLHVNVETLSFKACIPCGTFWLLGCCIFRTWWDETPDIWQRNRALLDGLAEVEPYYPPELMVVPASDDEP